eukprot:692233-Alexandrium_andersonii.AAC.1
MPDARFSVPAIACASQGRSAPPDPPRLTICHVSLMYDMTRLVSVEQAPAGLRNLSASQRWSRE